MEIPYWHDIQQTTEIHRDIEQTKTLSSAIYIENTKYISMVNAHLNYGILVLGFVLKRLIKIQNAQYEQ